MAPTSQRNIVSMFGGAPPTATPGTPERLNSMFGGAPPTAALSTPNHLNNDQSNTPNTRNRGQNKRNYRHMDSFGLDEPIESPSRPSKKPRSQNTPTLESQGDPLPESQASQSEA